MMGRQATEAVMWFFERIVKCPCGSGAISEPVCDAQGIYLCRVCGVCRDKKLAGYRPEILEGYDQSDVDEPIEPEG